MDRENFYILLELPIDPPETDLKTIEEAITKKQAEWSRLRNHPTKGLQVQKYINMIPEIRQVMMDDSLRAKEAQAAKDSAEKDKESKLPDIDRHIDILMGKGFITKEELIKLSEIHGFSQGEIQDRVTAKKNETFTRIDQQIGLRMAKGYITEPEIDKIAKRNAIPVDEVRKRVRCPIRKEEDKGENGLPRQLDRTIEKSINDNLRILNKRSLYDFLGRYESEGLKELQEAAARKKKELAATSRKDANVTAGITLVGHCATIFKTDESRNAYDVSLARARLSELDSDIDIAGMSGKIRPEYFQILVQKAVDFGMETEEAERYIKDYCRRKNWSIELAPEKRRMYAVFGVAGAVIVALVIVLAVTFALMYKHHARKSQYTDLIHKVESQPNPEVKLNLLRNYVDTHSSNSAYSDYTKDADKRIALLRKHIEEKTFNSVMSRMDALIQNGQYEEAETTGRSDLKKISTKSLQKQVQQKITQAVDLAEKRDYKNLSDVMITGKTDEKIKALTDYLKKHPNGAHKDEVKQLIANMSGEYYIYIQHALKSYEAEKNWSACAALCENYIQLYDNSYADKLRAQLEDYKKNIKEDEVFAALENREKQYGDDYASALQMYHEYLSAYPDTPLKPRIDKQIAKLEDLKSAKEIQHIKAEMRELLKKSGGRYVEKKDGVVLDTKTGMMWTLIDSDAARGGNCLTYEAAQKYVKSLDTGGYTDWRLPTPDELMEIYKTAPFFPDLKTNWYWTSKYYSSYSDGWHKIVEAVSSQSDKNGTIRKDAMECGDVRAVRGK